MPKGHPLGVEDIDSFQNPHALLELCHTGQKQGIGVATPAELLPHTLSPHPRLCEGLTTLKARRDRILQNLATGGDLELDWSPMTSSRT